MSFWDDLSTSFSNFTGGLGMQAPKSFSGRLATKPSGPVRNYSNVSEGDAGRRAEQQRAGYPAPPTPVDPLEQAMKFAQGFGTWSGGSSGSAGSPGNGAAIQAIVDQINQNKADGGKRFETNKARLGDIYGQLATSLKPNAGLTKARYDTAIAQAGSAGKGIADATVKQQNTQNAQRDTGLSALGIDPNAVHAAASQENTATNEGLGRLAENNGTWGNLEGVLSNSQQARDKLDVQGAQDAGILAERELTDNYEAYLKDLDKQISQAWAGYQPPSGGSGGTAATYSNPMLDTINGAIMDKMLYNAGLGKDPTGAAAAGYVPSAQDYATLHSQLGSGLNAMGKPYSTPELHSILSPSAFAAYNYRP